MDERATTSVRTYLEELVAAGGPLGVQMAAHLHGELVVDVWAGAANRATGRPTDGNTLVILWCAGKGPLATCVHLLAERGQLDYDAPSPATTRP
jgi:CubicO group peptidase (beta-lactamase class C family)